MMGWCLPWWKEQVYRRLKSKSINRQPKKAMTIYLGEEGCTSVCYARVCRKIPNQRETKIAPKIVKTSVGGLQPASSQQPALADILFHPLWLHTFHFIRPILFHPSLGTYHSFLTRPGSHSFYKDYHLIVVRQATNTLRTIPQYWLRNWD